ncbi:MAG: DUF4249 family protein [Cyclobacteriaceae bacterium]
MTVRSTIALIIAALLLMRCEEQFVAELNVTDLDLIVVDGILTNENLNHRIKVTRPHTELGGIGIPVSGAVLEIYEGDTKKFTVTEFPVGSGEYFTEQMRAVVGEVYTLRMFYGGKVFFAQNVSTPVEPLETIQYSQSAASPDLFRIELNESGRDPNFISHVISWQGTQSCQVNETCGGVIVHYDLKTADANELFKPDKKEFLIPAGAMVVRKKYSVNPSYRSFLRGVLSETEWRGGVFDIQRDNASTNLSAGAIGFFAVSTVVSDTTIIQ